MTVSVEKAECKLSGAYSFTVHFTSQMEEMKKSDHIAVQWMYGENTFEFYSWNIYTVKMEGEGTENFDSVSHSDHDTLW